MGHRRTLLLAALVVWAAPAIAQEPGSAGSYRKAMVDSVVVVQDYFGDAGAWETQFVLDLFSSVELAPGLQVSGRPLFWRKPNGEWTSAVEHASLRYEFHKGSNWRIEAGKFPSPIGLGMMENRASVNDGLLWCHRPYYGSLPAFEGGPPRHALVSASYPVGAQLNTSSDRWDARVALVDRAPVTVSWVDDDPRRANALIGAGITPRQGLRLGVAGAWGRSGRAGAETPYRLLNLEGEWAFGHTRVSGEWTRDVFETAAGDHVASGWTLQATQALSPRLFVHSRFSTVESPLVAEAGLVDDRFWSADSTVGVHVSADTILRVGHAAIRGWGDSEVDHQIGVSMVWARRWW